MFPQLTARGLLHDIVKQSKCKSFYGNMGAGFQAIIYLRCFAQILYRRWRNELGIPVVKLAVLYRWLACWSLDRAEPWPGSLKCGFKQDTLLLACLSQSKFINERLPADMLWGRGGGEVGIPAMDLQPIQRGRVEILLIVVLTMPEKVGWAPVVWGTCP